jgi:hypothetical protein
MAQYSKNIISRDEKYEFCFTEIFEAGLVRVFITVTDADGRLICFSMKRNEHKHWKIVEARSLPVWIIALENELSHCIDGNHPTEYQAKKSLYS